MEWQQGLTIHSADARTDFASFRIFWDTKNTAGIDDVRYEARIETINGAGLHACADLPTMDAAKAWCEEGYADLLTAELARVRGKLVSVMEPSIRAVVQSAVDQEQKRLLAIAEATVTDSRAVVIERLRAAIRALS